MEKEEGKPSFCLADTVYMKNFLVFLVSTVQDLPVGVDWI